MGCRLGAVTLLTCRILRPGLDFWAGWVGQKPKQVGLKEVRLGLGLSKSHPKTSAVRSPIAHQCPCTLGSLRPRAFKYVSPGFSPEV